MNDLIGQMLDRYHITESLGQGGMATVYKAFDTRLERYVAIKFIRPDAVNKDIFLKRFEREAKALAKLSHPNIVKVHDYGSHQNVPYIVMEYIPGGTLKQRLGKPLSIQDAVRLILPIARTLDYTHRQNIIHRDVKPANFLITESGEPMLSDFGIARMMEQSEAAPLTSTGAGIGTPEYMAPEQARGEKVDQRADIYSLGIVFYELITGAKPFTADTPMAVLMKHVSEPPPSPRLYVPDLPVEVDHILQKALAKNQEDRYQSMGQFAAALEKILLSQQIAPAYQTVRKSEGENPVHAARTPSIPPPVFNYPPVAQSRPKDIPQPSEPRPKSRLGLWLGGGAIGLLACIALITLLYIGSSLVGEQQNASITGTAQSLASTIQANANLRTREAEQQTATANAVLAQKTASAVSASQTSQAQNNTVTALAQEQNRNATSTALAQQQLATQNALETIMNDLQTAQQNWSAAYTENFSSSENWGTGTYESEWWQGTKMILSGRYRWEMTALQGFYHYVTGSDTIYSNFMVSLDCGQFQGNESGEVGLVVMQTDNGKYYFIINPTTLRYQFLLFANGEWQTLASEKTQTIRSGEMNNLIILSEAGVFTLFINNEFITQIQNDQIDAGEIAITAGLSNPEEQAAFEFDNFTIKTP